MDTIFIESNIPFISTKVDGEIKLLKYISKDMNKTSLESLKILNSYIFFKRKRIEVERNASDFLNYYTSCLSNPLIKFQNFLDLEPLIIEFNRLFINFSTSVRVLTSIVEKKIKDTYTISSAEFVEYEALRKSFYESYFSYRFIYHMRNFGLHFRDPIYFVNFEFDKYVNNMPTVSDLQVMFVKSHLLSDKEFARKMKHDLDKYGLKFPVTPIIIETLKWLNDYFLKFIQLEKTSYITAIETIESIISTYDFDNIGISLKQYTELNIFKISTTEIPLKLISEIKANLSDNNMSKLA